MKETKIRIGTRSVQQAQVDYEIRQAIDLINAPLREAFESIGFTASEELLKDCLDGGREITQQYYERLAEELKIMSSPSSRQIFEKAGQESIKQFHVVRNRVVDKCGMTVQKYITLDGDIAVFSEESQKQLDEDMGIYITDPEEIELYNLHQKACEALNNLFQCHIEFEWHRLFDIDNKQFKPALANYDVILTKIKKVKENGK